MSDQMTYGELEVLADIRVQTPYVTILDRIIFLPYIIVEAHGFGSTPVHSISGDVGRVSDYGMCEQFRFLLRYLDFVVLAFPLNLNKLSCPSYLFDSAIVCSKRSARVSPPIVFTSLKCWHVQPW